jgi:hypothetical protein
MWKWETEHYNSVLENHEVLKFHFWEYINRNQTFILDFHRPFICSVLYISQFIHGSHSIVYTDNSFMAPSLHRQFIIWLLLYILHRQFIQKWLLLHTENSHFSTQTIKNGSYSKPTVNKGLLLYSLQRQFIHKWLLLYKDYS